LSKSLTIGVDIGGTRTKYGLVDIALGKILDCIILPTEKENSIAFLQQTSNAITQLKKVADENNGNIEGIGFGIPGYINKEAIIETTYGFLTFMENYLLKAIIEKEYNLTCLLDNDARTISLGEALFGKGKNYSRVLTLTLGTGVGVGFVVNKQLNESLPLAHMAGHIKITDEGELCYCGKTGCLESLVSATGIIGLAKKLNWQRDLSAEFIFDAALKNETIAVKIIDTIINYLHIGIHNYVNIYAPDIIVLGGGIAKGLSPYLKRIKGQSYLSPFPNYSFQLQVSELNEEAGIVGSAALFKTNKA